MNKKIKKGANLNKIEELLKQVDDVIKEESVEITNQENIEEEIEEIKEVIEIKNIINQEKEEVKDMNKLILNREIRRAIKSNEGVTTKGLTGKQLNGIMNNYKQAVGEEMNKSQVNYIKTLNSSQAESIIFTINAFKKYLKAQQVTA